MSHKLAILIPGFLDSPDYPHLVKLDQDLTRLGYEVVRITPTGTWELNADISQYSITQTLKDVEAIISQHSDKQIIIGGHSLGGQISLLFTAKHPFVAATISIMGASSFIRPENYQDRVIEWKKLPYKSIIRDLPEDSTKNREFKLPYSFVKDTLKHNVLNVIKNVIQPTLFVVGEKDILVTPTHTQQIYTQANQPKKLVIIKNIDHEYRHRPKEIKLVNQEVVNFLKDQGLV